MLTPPTTQKIPTARSNIIEYELSANDGGLALALFWKLTDRAVGDTESRRSRTRASIDLTVVSTASGELVANERTSAERE
jgi:curli biogenesis system outer membrane secretion channel CsgG